MSDSGLRGTPFPRNRFYAGGTPWSDETADIDLTAINSTFTDVGYPVLQALKLHDRLVISGNLFYENLSGLYEAINGSLRFKDANDGLWQWVIGWTTDFGDTFNAYGTEDSIYPYTVSYGFELLCKGVGTKESGGIIDASGRIAINRHRELTDTEPEHYGTTAVMQGNQYEAFAYMPDVPLTTDGSREVLIDIGFNSDEILHQIWTPHGTWIEHRPNGS